MAHIGLNYDIGDLIPQGDIDRIATCFAEVLLEVITHPAKSGLARALMVTDNLDFTHTIDEYSFSGGVAELIYGGNGNHHDIGQILGQQDQRHDTPIGSPGHRAAQ